MIDYVGVLLVPFETLIQFASRGGGGHNNVMGNIDVLLEPLVTQINLLGKRERCDRTNVVSFSVILSAWLTLPGWEYRCECHFGMVDVGVLVEPLNSCTPFCLAGGSGANATM